MEIFIASFETKSFSLSVRSNVKIMGDNGYCHQLIVTINKIISHIKTKLIKPTRHVKMSPTYVYMCI